MIICCYCGEEIYPYEKAIYKNRQLYHVDCFMYEIEATFLDRADEIIDILNDI